MKYTIISTFPEKGSKNIGDGLITSSTINAIKSVKGEHNVIQTVWRAADWEEIKSKVLDSDAIIFACLAIRNKMGVKGYPYLQKILDSKIPIGIIAAGTSLTMNNSIANTFNQLDKDSIELLKLLNKESLFFTTRGVLSQSFCIQNGINQAKFSGDIAFFDKRFINRKFSTLNQIKNIAISDPHYAQYNIESLDLLINELKIIFPSANITCILHGVNDEVLKYCKLNEVPYKKIYLNSDHGLDVYDDFDLHVGYRVHAHVSTLVRRKISYLLEQDGRGADYGLSINIKCSVSNFYTENFHPTPINIIKKILGKKSLPLKIVHLDPVFQISAMIKQDADTNFIKFVNLENQILHFNDQCLNALKNLP